MSILSSIIGLIQGNKATDAVTTANEDAQHGVQQAQQNANTAIPAAGVAANTAVSNAVGSANDTVAQLFNQQKNGLAPYQEAGLQGVAGIEGLAAAPKFAWDPTTKMNDPGFQFRTKTGAETITNNAAAHGLASSGNVLKALTDYGVGSAAQYENDDFTRALGTYNTNQKTALDNFTALSGLGERANTEFGTAARDASGKISNNTMAGGLSEANTDTSLAQFLASLDANSAVNAGKFRVNRGEGEAAGDINSGNQWAQLGSGVTDLFNVIAGMVKPKPATA